MAIIKIIPGDQILSTAKNIVRSTKKQLLLTMLLDIELETTNSGYLKLLEQKHHQGIIIKIICFGTVRDYESALKKFKFPKQQGYTTKLCSDINLAQRLLISDNKAMIFAVYTNNIDKVVCYTENRLIIKGFIDYFNRLFVKI